MSNLRSRLLILGASFAATFAWLEVLCRVTPDSIPTTYEVVATATAIACVWLTRRDDIWCWPVGIISVLFLAVALYGYHLTAQMWLQVLYFLPIQVLSWLWWRKREELPISRMFLSDQVLCIGGACVLTLISAVYFGSDKIGLLFWVDGAITGCSIMAQYLMGKRYAESWLWWAVAVNVPSILLFCLTGAYMLAMLYAGFLVHAVLGWFEWKKIAESNT